jgi:hypothetical protein
MDYDIEYGEGYKNAGKLNEFEKVIFRQAALNAGSKINFYPNHIEAWVEIKHFEAFKTELNKLRTSQEAGLKISNKNTSKRHFPAAKAMSEIFGGDISQIYNESTLLKDEELPPGMRIIAKSIRKQNNPTLIIKIKDETTLEKWDRLLNGSQVISKRME